MRSSVKRFAQRLCAAAAVVHFTLAQPLVLPRYAQAEAATPRRLNADGLLRQARQGLALTVASARRAPGIRGKAAGPFVKSLRETDKALHDLREAAASKRTKDFAKALSRANRAVGRFNGAYNLSGLRSGAVKKGVRDFNKSWKAYFARVGGAKSAATPKSTQENGRRIAALKNRVSDLRKRDRGDVRQRRELDRMIQALERAEAANRRAASQWLALALLDEVFGWYGGTYDYIAVVDPAYAADFRDVYVYWNDVSTYYEVQYATYYESYSFVTYEETVTVEEEYAVTFTSEEETLITAEETAIETSTETLLEQSEAAGVLETETAALAEADEQASADPVEDPAEIPDPEADAQTLDESAPALDPDEALASVPEGAADAAEPDDAALSDQVDPAEADAPDQPGDPSPAETAEPDEMPEDSAPGEPDEAAPGTEEPGDLAEPDESQEDAAPAEAAPDMDEPGDAEPDNGGNDSAPEEEAVPDIGEPEAAPEEVQEEAAPVEESAPEEVEAAPEESMQEEPEPEVVEVEEPVDDVSAPAEEDVPVQEAPADDGASYGSEDGE